MELTECLSKNHHLIGPNCSNLGKKNRHFLFHSKVFLSFSDEKGWEIKKLNSIQLIMRKIFGVYKSTHLDQIAKNLHRVNIYKKSYSALSRLFHNAINSLPFFGTSEPKNELIDCHARVQELWTKKNVIALGNATLSEASLICFAEHHLDDPFKGCITQIINDNYKSGDIILVEGVAVQGWFSSLLNLFKENNDHQHKKNLRPGAHAQGWEPKNFRALGGAPFQRSEEKYKKLISLSEYFVNDLRQKGDLTEKELIILKTEIDKFINDLTELNKYYKSDSKLVLNSKKILYHCFEKIKTGTFSTEKEHGLLLHFFIIDMLVELEKRQSIALYNHITPEENERILKGIGPRNESLIAQINWYRKEGRRVFVIAGASHLLQYPRPHPSCQTVKDTLNKGKFTVITNKRDFRSRVAQHNSELKIRSETLISAAAA